MLPSQILVNTLLYDASEMAIPTDNVGAEQLRRSARWDMGFIRRFMMCFGPISSIFDFCTFAVMLLMFHAGPALFRSGWFVESLATQGLVIFAIRTRAVPFFRSVPSAALTATTLAVVLIAGALPFSPARPRARLRPAAGPVLRRARLDDRDVPRYDRGREALLLRVADRTSERTSCGSRGSSDGSLVGRSPRRGRYRRSKRTRTATEVAHAANTETPR